MRDQHGIVVRRQLLDLGYTPKAIEHRIANGRLHRIGRGVYAVGRPQVSRHGLWMAATLSCGPGAALSHEHAAALWGLRAAPAGAVAVSVAGGTVIRRSGIVVHRRPTLAPEDVTRQDGIPVTTTVCTLVDLAAILSRDDIEAAINEADKLGLTDPEELRAALDMMPRRLGLAALRETLDRRTFVLTDSQLERLLLRIARKAGLPRPQTGVYVNGFKVDFYWPELGLVVETDGLRYHRTPAQQANDRLRDQAHAAAGLTSLRFTHAQVRFEPARVEATLKAVARRLAERRA